MSGDRQMFPGEKDGKPEVIGASRTPGLKVGSLMCLGQITLLRPHLCSCRDLGSMATQGDYTAVANALMHLIYTSIGKLPPWEQNYIPKEKIPAAAGQAAQVAVDALDAYRNPPAAKRGRPRK